MIQAFMEVGSVEYILLLVVFLVLVAIMYRLAKKAPTMTRADMLKQTYATMTEELIDNTSDEDLVEAVVANLMAKADDRDPDVYYTVMALSPGRRAVYSVWLTVKELKHDTLESFRKSLSARYGEPAIEGLRLLGAEACAMLLEKAMEADPVDELLSTAFLDGVEQEKPLSLAVTYIRENPSEFTDDDVITVDVAEEVAEETAEETTEE